MKYKLLFLLLWGGIPMFSQLPIPPGIEVNTSFANQINAVFSNLDKSKIPNGLLQDFAMEYSSLEAYSGSISDSTYVHPGTLKQLYSSLLMSRINPNTNQGFVTYQNFETNWKNEREKNTITMSGLYFKYSKFVENAYPNKITITNNKLYDKYISGVWQNPYEQQRLFAISPSVINYEGLNFSVKFPSNLWYTNDSSSIQSIQINFDDGNGYVNVNPGQQLSINYTSEGIKTWTYKISLSSGGVLYSHSKLNFNEIPGHCPYGTGSGNNCSIETLQISSSKLFSDSRGSVTLQINYGNTYGEIRRPLIVAEGLDLGAVVTPELPFGESDLISFLETAFNSGSQSLQNQLVGSTSLYDNDQEYDIIYVNWDDGTDYIQRNAYALETVIKWVNDRKTTSEENVVIGQSMGGLVARYALKDMEDNNILHDTRLFVSQDSPHLGANIPLGYQYAVRNGRNQYVQSPVQLFGGDIILPLFNNGVGASDYLGLLDEPAVKQMLINWVDKDYSIDNTIHNSWQSELRDMGYPKQTRNVAISNGSQCAITQGFNPGDILFGVNGRIKTGWLTDILTNFTGFGNIKNGATFLAATYFTLEPGFLFGVLPGNSKLNADIKIRALPNQGQTNEVYSANVTFTKKVLWLIDINATLINESFDSPSNALPYDYYPGGAVSTSILSSSSSNSNALYGLNINITSDPDFVLVPTVSALDMGMGETPLNDSDYLGIIKASSPPPSPKDIPFVNFITSYNESPFVIQQLETNGSIININNFNQFHLDLFEDNGDWLASEIDPNTAPMAYDCSFICDNLDITGPETLCNSGNYSIPAYGDASYSWRVSPSTGISISNSNSNEVTISYDSSGQGEYILFVEINSPSCGSTEISKAISIGKPKFLISPLDSNAPSTQAWAYINGDGGTLASQNITQHPTYTVVSSSGTSTVNILGPYYSGDEYNIRATGSNNSWFKTIDVHIVNNCGMTTKRVYLSPPPPSGGGGCRSIIEAMKNEENTYRIIDPCRTQENPIQSQDGKDQSSYAKDKYSILVFDLSGVKLIEVNKPIVNLNSLKNGYYIIKAMKNEEEMTKKVSKNN